MRVLVTLYNLLIAIAIFLGIYMVPGREAISIPGENGLQSELAVISKKQSKGVEINIGRETGQYHARKTSQYKFHPADDREDDAFDNASISSWAPEYLLHSTSALKHYSSVHLLASFKKLLLYPKHSFW